MEMAGLNSNLQFGHFFTQKPKTNQPMKSETYKAKGTIKNIGELQEFSGGFTKREIVLTIGDKYPQDVAFEAVKHMTDDLDQFRPGDELTICFNLRGREWEGRHFVNLQAWRFENHVSMAPESPVVAPAAPAAQSTTPATAQEPPRQEPLRQASPEPRTIAVGEGDTEIPF